MFKFHTKEENRRYRAMKKFMRTRGFVPERCKKPCIVEFEGERYTAFVDRYSIVMTKEDVRRVSVQQECWFDEFAGLFGIEEKSKTLNIRKVILQAKKKGYKKRRFDSKCRFAVKYKKGYFNIDVLLRAYSIIDNGEELEISKRKGCAPLMMRNSVGVCLVLPIRYSKEFFENITIMNV